MRNIATETKNEILGPYRVGDIASGEVIGIDRSAIYIDLGARGTGIIFGKEFQEAKNILKGLKPGEKIFAKITDLENDDGYIELSLNQAGRDLNWETLREKKEKGESFTVKILKANKGGLLAEVSGIPAFLPVSQLSPENYPRVEGGDQNKILRELQQLIGKELEVKIFSVDPREEKLILSERAKDSAKMKEVLSKYKVGDVVDADITGIVDFGAFVKFGEDQLEGLIHISELDWQLIENPSQVVKIGQKVKAKIIEILDDRVSLSLRALKKDPWEGIEKKYKKGDAIKGKVTKFNPFGAFVEISPKIQGLVHISEFGTRTKMEETLKLGGKYSFQILQIVPAEHRMTLKLEAEKEKAKE